MGLKTLAIVNIENLTGKYVPSEINAIEKALNIKILRGKKKWN